MQALYIIIKQGPKQRVLCVVPRCHQRETLTTLIVMKTVDGCCLIPRLFSLPYERIQRYIQSVVDIRINVCFTL